VRAQVADFQVIEQLEPTPTGLGSFRCRAPQRLGGDEVLVTELACPPEGLGRVVEAALRLAALEGVRLVEMIEIGPDSASGAYMASALPSGGSLRRPRVVLDQAHILEAVATAAEAAHAMHEAGSAHGAICPATVVILSDGPALMPSFPHLQEALVLRTNDWTTISTLDPDLLRGFGANRSTDLWALGATLHACLSTKPLFPGLDSDPPVVAVQKVLYSEPEVDPGLPKELGSLVASCLSWDPAGRPPSASAFAQALRSQVGPGSQGGPR